MPIYKCVFECVSQKYGWEETHYLTKATPEAASGETRDAARFRGRLMAEGVFIGAYKVSDIAIRGDTTRTIPQNVPRHIFGGTTGPRDVPEVGWLTRWHAGPIYRRSLVLRGGPDDAVFTLPANPTPYQVLPAFKQLFEAYRAEMVRRNFGIYALDRGAGNPLRKITVVNQAVLGGYYLLTIPGHNYQIGERVLLYGFDPCIHPQLVGEQEIRDVVGDDITLLRKTPIPLPTPYKGNWKARQASRIMVPYTNAVLVRPTIRRTGPAGRIDQLGAGALPALAP